MIIYYRSNVLFNAGGNNNSPQKEKDSMFVPFFAPSPSDQTPAVIKSQWRLCPGICLIFRKEQVKKKKYNRGHPV
jgi:hypothetical protein